MEIDAYRPPVATAAGPRRALEKMRGIRRLYAYYPQGTRHTLVVLSTLRQRACKVDLDHERPIVLWDCHTLVGNWQHCGSRNRRRRASWLRRVYGRLQHRGGCTAYETRILADAKRA